MSRAVVRRPDHPICGSLKISGDKSVSIRRALLSLFVDERVILENYGTGEDCAAALACIRTLGKSVETDGERLVISGPRGCRSAKINCGNSGTTARLLMGILAGQEGEWELTGDASLSQRPMERAAVPLREMGARIELDEGHLPAGIIGSPLHGIRYHSPVVSAQVKSAVLLAAMQAKGITSYRESCPTRDHTERLLGLETVPDGRIELHPDCVHLTAENLSGMIPGDLSSVAFWAAASLIVPDSELQLPGILLNPHRTAMLDLLREQGARIEVHRKSTHAQEDFGDLVVRSGELRPFVIRQPMTAKVIDEIPVLAVLATAVRGESEFHDVGELRLKESDRLEAVTRNLLQMNADVKLSDDGFIVQGLANLKGGIIESGGDHRIAMAFAVAGLHAEGETEIHDADCAAVSYPEFWDHLADTAEGSVKLLK